MLVTRVEYNLLNNSVKKVLFWFWIFVFSCLVGSEITSQQNVISSHQAPNSLIFQGNEKLRAINDSSVLTTQEVSSEFVVTSINPDTSKSPIVMIDNSSETTPNNSSQEEDCVLLIGENDLDSLTQEQFITNLTAACRYDKLVRPGIGKHPLDINLQMDLRHLESTDSLQFLSHMVLQYRYVDERLKYSHISPNRGMMMGQELLRDKIWVPHMIVRNEQSTTIMGADGKDLFVTISPDGFVTYSYRMTVTFYCWMNLKKFPFDVQECDIVWNSWAYNTSNMLLHWDKDSPVRISPNLHLTEFTLNRYWTESTTVPATFLVGGYLGNYSAIVFNFQLTREVGYYILDYFLPSIMLVIMSWVTFWLQADAGPPRATIGTSTMLAFITLNGGLTKNLPKVSYVKASEIWFLGCALFIFSSLAEFAFVNVIWRRKKKIELIEKSGKNILKGALTPSLARKQIRKAESENTLYKSHSCSSLNGSDNGKQSQANYLTVHGFSATNMQLPRQPEFDTSQESVTSIQIPEIPSNNPAPTWQTMTPQEVAIWIDKKSRLVFPVLFLIFNLFYWSFVYAL